METFAQVLFRETFGFRISEWDRIVQHVMVGAPMDPYLATLAGEIAQRTGFSVKEIARLDSNGQGAYSMPQLEVAI